MRRSCVGEPGGALKASRRAKVVILFFVAMIAKGGSETLAEQPEEAFKRLAQSKQMKLEDFTSDEMSGEHKRKFTDIMRKVRKNKKLGTVALPTFLASFTVMMGFLTWGLWRWGKGVRDGSIQIKEEDGMGKVLAQIPKWARAAAALSYGGSIAGAALVTKAHYGNGKALLDFKSLLKKAQQGKEAVEAAKAEAAKATSDKVEPSHTQRTEVAEIKHRTAAEHAALLSPGQRT